MKTKNLQLSILLLSALLSRFSARAQGYFLFAGSKGSVWECFSTGSPQFSSGNVYVTFLWANSGSFSGGTSTNCSGGSWSTIASLLGSGFNVAINAATSTEVDVLSSTSFLAKGGFCYNGCSTFQVANTSAGNSYTIVPVAWASSGGSTLAAAMASGAPVGYGNSFTYASGNSLSTLGTFTSYGMIPFCVSYLLSPIPPSIVSQPPATLLTKAGTNVTISVTTSGSAPLFYQWRFNSNPIPGQTNASLVLSQISNINAGSYDVVVTNSIGSVTSSATLLSVLDYGQPQVWVNGLLVSNATFTAVSSATVTFTDGYPSGFLFYTLDGTQPNTGSTLYTGPFTVSNSCTLRVMTLSADFSQTYQASSVSLIILPTYNLQTSVTGSGSVTPMPLSGPYGSNSIVILTATASTYWAFDHWTGDASGNKNPFSLTMNGPRNVQAVFVPTHYPLTATSPGGGTILADGQSIVSPAYFPIGNVVSLTATPSNGWVFLGWQGDVSGTNNPANVTLSGARNVQAIFGTSVSTNAVGGGGIILNLPNPVAYGKALTASAVPNNGKYFVTWSGTAITGTTSPIPFSVTSSNPTVNALFTTLPTGKVSLGVAVVGDGAVDVSPKQNYYNPGDIVTLTASNTASGISFFGWSGDATGLINPLVVTVSTNKIVRANFGALPSVNLQPTNISVLAGSNVVLNANGSGIAPLNYQWQKDSIVILGETNAQLVLNNIQAGGMGIYSVVVSNPFGSTNAVASVTVLYPPSVTIQPVSQIVPAGTATSLGITAIGTAPLSYQWYSTKGLLSGATGASYPLNPARTNDWDSYLVIVTNAYGAATSSVASLVVYQPVTFSVNPQNAVVPLGGSTSFSGSAIGYPAPTVYQWTFNGTNLPGATATSLSVTNVRLQTTGVYQLWAGNGYSTNASTTAGLYVAPTLTTPFRGATTTWGNSASFNVGAIGSGTLSYQWYRNGVAMDGATTPTLYFDAIQITNAGLYSVVVASAYGSATNVTAQVVVNPADLSLGFYPGLTIGGASNYSYVIQRSNNLTDTNAWNTLTNLTLTRPVQLWIDTNVNSASPFNSQYFYRVLPGN